MTRLHVLTWVIAMVIVSKAQKDEYYGQDSPLPRSDQKESPCAGNATGFYPDPKQCDRYYECRRGQIKYHLCEDGFLFVALNPLYQRCDYPFRVDCGDRTELQTPQPIEHCPRRNGLFPDPGDCGFFWECRRGSATQLTCQGSLAFNPKTGVCHWPADVQGCEDWTSDKRKKKTTPKPVPVEDIIDQVRNKGPTQASVPSRVPASRATSAPSRSPQRSTTHQAPTRRPIPPRRRGPTSTTTTQAPNEEVEYYYDDEPAPTRQLG